MEAVNALGLKPLCIVPDKTSKPRRVFSIPSTPHLRIQDTISRLLHGSSLVLVPPFLSPKLGLALTYEEALQQSINTSSGGEFDTGGGSFEGIVNFATENPIVIGGALAVLAVPLIVSQLLGKSKPFGVESAKTAFAKLADDPAAQLLDIRSLKQVKEMGSPDITSLKKKPVSIVYTGDDKPAFLQKLALKFKDPEATTLFILDKFDGNSELVAELVTANGFKAAYAIKDGAEGPRGWMNSGLPWIQPKKSFSLDFGDLTGSLPESSEALPVALGIAAATGIGLLAFTEIETILQVLGSAAIIQVLSKNLLFAKDRKQTLEQVDEFLNTKIAPKELISELKEIGAALLPLPVNSKALPAPAEASNEPPPLPNVESITELQVVEEKVEAAAEPSPAPGNNSVPQTEAKVELIPRPLSPYTMYPDLKPPSSPRPSQPSPGPTPLLQKVEFITELKVTEEVVEKVESITELKVTEEVVETATAPETNSVIKAEAKTESQSPYPWYPDLKPPSSPCPSQP